MAHLIAKIIPLGVAAAVSPTLLGVTILILTSKTHPRSRAFAYFAGSVLTLAAIAVVALGASSAVKSGGANKPSLISAVVDLILAAFLFYVAYKELYGPQKPKKAAPPKTGDTSLGRVLITDIGLGILMTVTDVSSLIFYLSAVKETADAGLGGLDQFTVMSIMVVFVTLPISLPLLITVAAPAKAAHLLDIIREFLQAHGRQVIAAVSLFYGFYLLYKGVHALIQLR
jgi:hypothetical protein